MMTPMQKLALDHLRPDPDRDAIGVAEARGGWCGGQRLEAVAYPIRRHDGRTLLLPEMQTPVLWLTLWPDRQ